MKIKGVYELVHAISFAMEHNPDGECRIPSRPTIEERWTALAATATALVAAIGWALTLWLK